MIVQRVGLSRPSPVLCSKCVFLKHRKCRVETLGLQREALKGTGFPPVEAGPEDDTWQAGCRRRRLGLELPGREKGLASSARQSLSIQKALYL